MAEPSFKLYRVRSGGLTEKHGVLYSIPDCAWDELITREDLYQDVSDLLCGLKPTSCRREECEVQAPIGSQDVWAAGVTYYRSRDARMEEAKSAGGGDFYDRVYRAERPELFFKSTASRVVGVGGKVAIRQDAK